MDLKGRHCVPCEGGTPLDHAAAAKLHKAVPGWTLTDRDIRRTFRCRDFAEALGRIATIGALAESEGHHPDLHLTGYRDLEVVLWTHAVGGLSENDFILAAKIDAA